MATQAPQEADPDRRVLTEAVTNAADLLGLSNRQLAEVIGVSASTVSRMQRGAYHLQPGTKAWELSLLLVRVARSLGAVCAGDERVMRQWMQHPNHDLGCVPSTRIQHVDGLVEVVDYLDAHRAVL
ncbi:MbcA/ParS/Xre antitoxin family protein [Halorhodospira halophila]|uniref:MbcA/ParS/Xre antitoxin family protein n=1 Tax=Halorhodospira halophila TaxID=1053 RepID=UPI00191228E0|nr:antitoxin Xre-like helix-turn-helix domain-containing protein [Halorhodospira halophila]MBK5937564.1 hypothetical protein [Halorhodospira halophila]